MARGIFCVPAAALVMAIAVPARAADASAGAAVFRAECAECHSMKEGRHKKGPSLYAVVGRPAASISGVEYSEALRVSGWRWDAATLRRYLSQPASKANPGSKMKYEGLSDAKAMDDLLAYLAAGGN
jgi:cytochrome c